MGLYRFGGVQLGERKTRYGDKSSMPAMREVVAVLRQRRGDDGFVCCLRGTVYDSIAWGGRRDSGS